MMAKARNRGKRVPPPPTTPEIAESLARAGWPVFPVSIYEDDDGKRHKIPAVKWKTWATTDAEKVCAAWAGEHRNRWIGVYAGGAGIVTLDLDQAKGDKPSGAESLQRAGLTVPETPIAYDTPSGGRHYVYAAPEGVELTIAADLSHDGEKLAGVDVRSGAGLMIYYGPALDGPPVLPPAPDWLLVSAKKKGDGSSGDAGALANPSATEVEYTARLVPGKAPKALRKTIRAIDFPSGAAHAPMLEAVAELVSAGAKGAPVADLIAETRERYVGSHPDRGRDWDNAFAGSVKRFGYPLRSFALTKTERREVAARNRPDRVKGDQVTDDTTKDSRLKYGDDAALAVIVAQHFAQRLAYVSGAWWEYDGTRWRPVSEARVVELDRAYLRDVLAVEAVKSDRANVALWLTRKTTIEGSSRLIRGRLERRAEDFDAHPDELNVTNGIVDLRTGEIRPHDPERLHTKIAPYPYKPGATHPDWMAALTALPPKTAAWMQIRFGQAATGRTPDDDLLVILQGTGANGKSTVLTGVQAALGDYATTVPDKLLLGSVHDHPTAKMELFGARLAIAEELPEGRALNVRQLKELIGTTHMTARRMRQDFVQWSPTHSLMVSSNYEPRVAETDHGTWRRLVLVRFPYRFVDAPAHDDERSADRRLRSRLERGKVGRGEAVLAWIVEGARQWYAGDMTMPEPPRRVADDTGEWRMKSDVALAFANDRLVFGPDAFMAASDLVEAVKTWLAVNGHTAWSTETIVARVASHDMFRDNAVRKDRKRLPDGTRPTYYFGVGLRPNEAVLTSFTTSVHK